MSERTKKDKKVKKNARQTKAKKAEFDIKEVEDK